ncbi:homoserine dehydrogenase [Oceanicaulis sp.]|uniref:homoserine dehydrogenase n=1 Tax=Oceanicaulis sp. TaxID=1924941 RepID=UPI003D281120
MTYPALLDRPVQSSPTPPPVRRMRAIMLGCGVVGGGVIERLPEGVELLGILTRTPRPEGVSGFPVFTDADALFALRPELVIEALPGGAEAEALVERAVNAGCHVVTANKDVAARRPDLVARTYAAGRTFACSSAVGGGAPVLETVARLRENGVKVGRVRGVLNGTSNFVLDRLASGRSLSASVKEAQDAGFAEADPSADLDGLDAANKLALIAREAWGAVLDPAAMPTASIRDLPAHVLEAARLDGRRIRQIGCLSRTASGVSAQVRLEALPLNDPLSRARAEGNVVVLLPERGAEVIVAGKGAGRLPTAGSLIGDLNRLLKAQRS